ncbi:MAG TPA: TPM domain-containing protein [Vicinamibacterales bacterium]
MSVVRTPARRLRLLPAVLLTLLLASVVSAQDSSRQIPALTGPVNDFASVLDAADEAEIERMVAQLQQATGDVIVVATIQSVDPFADIREYAVEMFENHGRGIGERDKDNGLLILLSVGDRQVWIEVGYGLEGAITDGFAGETSRQYMIPFFRDGRYGEGIKAGVARLAARIAQDRGVSLEGVPAVRAPARKHTGSQLPWGLIIFFVIVLLMNLRRPRRRHRRHWTGGPWSGWSGGVGPFGGTFGGWGGGGGGFSGGGFGGGGFGGFGGGRSGGGGGGGGW